MATKHDYDFVDTILEEYRCGICKDVLQEPHATECCGQHFCKDCLEKSLQRQKGPFGRRVKIAIATKQCPHCRAENFNHIKYLPLERKIKDLKVYCPNRYKRCVVRVRLGDIENHMQKCDYATVSCPNSCGEQLLRKELQLHLGEVCNRRNVRCQYCGQEGIFFKITSPGLHLKKCLKYPLPCDNGCGKVKIKREDMKQHRSACPLEPVKCPYQEVGCPETITRKDLESHVANSTQQHLSQLMSAHMKLKKEFERYVLYITYKQVPLVMPLCACAQWHTVVCLCVCVCVCVCVCLSVCVLLL